MGGIMSDQVLCCINGTQDISDFHLRDKEGQFMRTGCVLVTYVRVLTHFVSVCPHRQVAGHPLQQFDTLAQGTLCEKHPQKIHLQTK